MGALGAVRELARQHDVRFDETRVLKDGSNLLVHLSPAPVMVRIATFTAAVRVDPWPYLEREVALTSYLFDVGAAVVPPSDLIPSGPHYVEGWAMTCRRFVSHTPGEAPDGMTALGLLDDLHEAMVGFPGELPSMNPVRDDLDLAMAFGVRAGALTEQRARTLSDERDELLERLHRLGLPEQAQHGDAHTKNALLTPDGPRWIDFEDCCAGPRSWDLAVLARRELDNFVVRAIRGRFEPEELAIMMELRGLQSEIWNQLFVVRGHDFGVKALSGTARPRP